MKRKLIESDDEGEGKEKEEREKKVWKTALDIERERQKQRRKINDALDSGEYDNDRQQGHLKKKDKGKEKEKEMETECTFDMTKLDIIELKYAIVDYVNSIVDLVHLGETSSEMRAIVKDRIEKMKGFEHFPYLNRIYRVCYLSSSKSKCSPMVFLPRITSLNIYSPTNLMVQGIGYGQSEKSEKCSECGLYIARSRNKMYGRLFSIDSSHQEKTIEHVNRYIKQEIENQIYHHRECQLTTTYKCFLLRLIYVFNILGEKDRARRWVLEMIKDNHLIVDNLHKTWNKNIEQGMFPCDTKFPKINIEAFRDLINEIYHKLGLYARKKHKISRENYEIVRVDQGY
jgi:hypothetical protein